MPRAQRCACSRTHSLVSVSLMLTLRSRPTLGSLEDDTRLGVILHMANHCVQGVTADVDGRTSRLHD